ncbi:catalase family protein [Luteimonas yindakuii]|uniref:catalase family protein n=1 Tax=Luteimonas yindakuii TaxID=2565782 RepID=UPI0011078812|nr:catalase family protein [Luteimonas yindakuii]QCU72749.1 catalase family protein [Luteimonas yindakuii]
MTASDAIHYARYDDRMAEPREGEAELELELGHVLMEIVRTTWEHEGRALRAVHAKSHALLAAEVEVPALPPELAQGVFGQPAKYRAMLRLSTTPGDLLPDRVSTPRGIALRLCDVPGERLDGAQHLRSQDFLLVNAPRFNAPDGHAFLQGLRLLAKTTDRVPRTKELVSAIARGTERALEALGGESSALKAMGGQPPVHPLGEAYFTQVPHRFGDHIAKLQLVPMTPTMQALADQRLDLADDDALRTALIDHFARDEAVWELRAQLCTSIDEMPLEDASAEWDTGLSPYRTIATVRVPAQTAWSEARSAVVDDGMAFSPWLGVEAHRPLGQIMRLRRRTYERSQAFREDRMGPFAIGCPFEGMHGVDGSRHLDGAGPSVGAPRPPEAT